MGMLEDIKTAAEGVEFLGMLSLFALTLPMTSKFADKILPDENKPTVTASANPSTTSASFNLESHSMPTLPQLDYQSEGSWQSQMRERNFKPRNNY